MTEDERPDRIDGPDESRSIKKSFLGIFRSLKNMVRKAFAREVAAKEIPVTEQDMSVILNIAQLAVWMDDSFYPVEEAVTISKTRYQDNSYEVIYKYDDPGIVFLKSVVHFAGNSYESIPDRKEEATRFSNDWNYFKRLIDEDETAITVRNDLISWGKHSQFAIITGPDGPIGNLFLTRKGRVTFFVIFSGLYFDEPDSIRQLFSDQLTLLNDYRP